MSSKYRNVRTASSDGEMLGSKLEARRYEELLLLQRARLIRDLRRQVPFVLAPACRLHAASRETPPLRYLADFVYFDIEKGREVIEDTKGMVTEVYRIKRHLMKALLGLDIMEYKPRG